MSFIFWKSPYYSGWGFPPKLVVIMALTLMHDPNTCECGQPNISKYSKTQKADILNGSQLAKMKRVFLTCPCHKIYRGEAFGLKSCKYTWKITIFVKMWNLGQFCENLIFCQLLHWSSNLKILLHMCDTYNCDYLKHSTFRFNLIEFLLNTDFPFQFCVFYRKIT